LFYVAASRPAHFGDGDDTEAARIEDGDLAARGGLRDGAREGLAGGGAAAGVGIVADAGDPGASGLGMSGRCGHEDGESDERQDERTEIHGRLPPKETTLIRICFIRTRLHPVDSGIR
jgi:hypothetical protein